MRLGSGALFDRVGAFVALLLLAALVPCLAHGDTQDSDDLCLSFGLLIGPVVVASLAPTGHFHGAPVAVHQAVPADLPVPPPEA